MQDISQYLGLRITREENPAYTKKVKAILKIKSPTTKKRIKKFHWPDQLLQMYGLHDLNFISFGSLSFKSSIIKMDRTT